MQECVYILYSIYSRDTQHGVYEEQCICKILYYECVCVCVGKLREEIK